MKFRPNVHHKVSRVTPNHAPPTLPKKFGAVSPTKLKALVIKPVSGVYMNAKIRHTADEGTTYGAKKTNRKNHRCRTIRAHRIAKINGSTTSSGTVSRVNSTVCHIDAQKSELVRTSL